MKLYYAIFDFKMRHNSFITQIIPYLELDALYPLKELSARSGLTEHSLRYSIRKLVAQGLLCTYPLINRSALGLIDYYIVFSLRVRNRTVEARFLSFLAAQPGVVFLVALGGLYHYRLIVTARHPSALVSLFQKINEKFPNVIVDKKVASSVRYAIYPKKYLASTHLPRKERAYLEEPGSQSLDQLELEILRHLSTQPFTSWRKVSRVLDVSLHPVLKRIKSLEQRGILLGMAYDVEPLAYGYQDYIVLLERMGESSKFAENLFSIGKAHPNITQVTQLFGGWDFEFSVDVRKPEEIVPVLQEVSQLLGDENIRMLPLQQFRSVKFNPFPI